MAGLLRDDDGGYWKQQSEGLPRGRPRVWPYPTWTVLHVLMTNGMFTPFDESQLERTVIESWHSAMQYVKDEARCGRS